MPLIIIPINKQVILFLKFIIVPSSHDKIDIYKLVTYKGSYIPENSLILKTHAFYGETNKYPCHLKKQ